MCTRKFMSDLRTLKPQPPLVARVLWVRHCESCSNIHEAVTNPEEKYMIPPVCTNAGIRQAVASAVRVQRIAQLMNVRDVHFFCSYLPRAMLTAALLAAAYDEQVGRAPRVARVQTVCNIGEFGNIYEQLQHDPSGCVTAPSESTATKRNTTCWIRKINMLLEKGGVKVLVEAPVEPCVASDAAPCSRKKVHAWAHADTDYHGVLTQLVPQWLQAQADTPDQPQLFVIVSHGSYIKAALRPSEFSDYASKIPNTGMLLQHYEQAPSDAQRRFTVEEYTDIHFAKPQGTPEYWPPAVDGEDAELRRFPNLERLAAAAVRPWEEDPCEWKRTTTPWSACLRGARREALRALKDKVSPPVSSNLNLHAKLPRHIHLSQKRPGQRRKTPVTPGTRWKQRNIVRTK